jgi:hemerythrin-like domain-containing protein
MPESIAATLTADHRRCDRLLALVESATDAGRWERIDAEVQPFVQAMEGHFLFEEEVLFPQLVDSTPMAVGPTTVMRREHQQLRALLTDLSEAVQARDATHCLGVLETLHLATQQHNAKEEGILYPLADQRLAASASTLVGRFADRTG